MYHYFPLSFSLFQRLDPINKALHSVLITHLLCLHVDALQTFTCQKRWGQAGGFPKCCSGGEVCLHMWLSLWPLTLHGAICNTNKRRHPADFVALPRHTSYKLATPLEAPCRFGGHVSPLRNSFSPTRHISLSFWFKPETKEGLSVPLSLLFLFQNPPSCNDLHRHVFHSFPKGVLKVILHITAAYGPRKHDMGMRGGMSTFKDQPGFTYLFPLAQNQPGFK